MNAFQVSNHQPRQRFHFQFHKVGGMAIPTKRHNQFGSQSKRFLFFLKPHYVLMTCKNLGSTYGEFNLFFFEIWQIWGISPKKILYRNHEPFFCYLVTKFHRKKKGWSRTKLCPSYFIPNSKIKPKQFIEINTNKE